MKFTVIKLRILKICSRYTRISIQHIFIIHNLSIASWSNLQDGGVEGGNGEVKGDKLGKNLEAKPY